MELEDRNLAKVERTGDREGGGSAGEMGAESDYRGTGRMEVGAGERNLSTLMEGGPQYRLSLSHCLLSVLTVQGGLLSSKDAQIGA